MQLLPGRILQGGKAAGAGGTAGPLAVPAVKDFEPSTSSVSLLTHGSAGDPGSRRRDILDLGTHLQVPCTACSWSPHPLSWTTPAVPSGLPASSLARWADTNVPPPRPCAPLQGLIVAPEIKSTAGPQGVVGLACRLQLLPSSPLSPSPCGLCSPEEAPGFSTVSPHGTSSRPGTRLLWSIPQAKSHSTCFTFMVPLNPHNASIISLVCFRKPRIRVAPEWRS